MWLISYAVTEREITQGILKNNQSEDTCLCVMRKIPDIELHLTDPKAPKFIDLASQKEVDNEAQDLLKSLRNKKVPSKVQNTNLTQVGSPKSMVLCQMWLCFYLEQVCIPVGCVPRAYCPYPIVSGGWCLPKGVSAQRCCLTGVGGVCLGGFCLGEGVSAHWGVYPSMSFCEQND